MISSKFLILASICVSSAFGFYGAGDDVVALDPSNFDKKVIGSSAIWIIEFYAPWCGHCKALTPEWKKAATALKGVVKVGAVDADAHGALGGKYGVQGFPTIKVFGADKSKPIPYEGARTADAIAKFGLKQAKELVEGRLSGKKSGGSSGGSGGGDKPGNKDDVIELTDSVFKEKVLNSDDFWLVEFYAPWCGHCKRLEPEWAKAATSLKGKVKLGAVDATVYKEYAGQYGVQGFPTIKAFPKGPKDGSAIDYEGGRTASDIIRWAEQELENSAPPPELKELLDKASLDEACEKTPLCIISFLPHIYDCQSECRNNFISLLKENAEKFKKQKWGWLWLEGSSQPALEESVDVGGFGYPAMIAVNARKMKYSSLRSSFSKDGLHEFLRDLSYGKGSTVTVRNAKWPEIETRSAWDGKDKELPKSDFDDDDLPDLEPLDEL